MKIEVGKRYLYIKDEINSCGSIFYDKKHPPEIVEILGESWPNEYTFTFLNSELNTQPCYWATTEHFIPNQSIFELIKEKYL